MEENQIRLQKKLKTISHRSHFLSPLWPALPKKRTFRCGLLALCFIAATAGAPAGRRLVSAPIRKVAGKAAAAIACPDFTNISGEKSLVLIGGI